MRSMEGESLSETSDGLSANAPAPIVFRLPHALRSSLLISMPLNAEVPMVVSDDAFESTSWVIAEQLEKCPSAICTTD